VEIGSSVSVGGGDVVGGRGWRVELVGMIEDVEGEVQQSSPWYETELVAGEAEVVTSDDSHLREVVRL
jgi:hypothetical protein